MAHQIDAAVGHVIKEQVRGVVIVDPGDVGCAARKDHISTVGRESLVDGADKAGRGDLIACLRERPERVIDELVAPVERIVDSKIRPVGIARARLKLGRGVERVSPVGREREGLRIGGTEPDDAVVIDVVEQSRVDGKTDSVAGERAPIQDMPAVSRHEPQPDKIACCRGERPCRMADEIETLVQRVIDVEVGGCSIDIRRGHVGRATGKQDIAPVTRCCLIATETHSAIGRGGQRGCRVADEIEAAILDVVDK